MSQYNRSLKRGLAGIQGLNFAYRLNTWGPKDGPAMLPANTFARGYAPAPQGLASPFTWLQGVFGVESVPNMLNDGLNQLSDALDPLTGAQTTVQNILSKAQAYDSVTGAAVQSKAQAIEAEAVGLVSTYQGLQSAAQAISNQLIAAKGDPSTTKETVNAIRSQIPPLGSQIMAFQKAVSILQDHLNDLIKSAASGPGLGQTLESVAAHSVSTLTWIVGGGALVYFLAPTFVPRMIRGFRK